MALGLHIYTCARSTDADILERDLRRSPSIARDEVELTVLWDQPSASRAYADAMETASADLLIFAHCDVYFPEGWFERFRWEVERLTRVDPAWAVAAIIGITARGEFVGRAWDCSLAPLFFETRGLFGRALDAPVPIESCDEMVLIVRNNAGVRFDRQLPEFHLYGTDIALEAERRGRTCYALDMPLIHNAKAQLSLGPDYIRSYKYMVRKWRKRLPVQTTCGTLTANPFVLPLRRMRLRYKALYRSSTYSTQRLADPGLKANELGMRRLLAAPMEHAHTFDQPDKTTALEGSAELHLTLQHSVRGFLNAAPPRPLGDGKGGFATTCSAGSYRVQILRSRDEIEPFREFWNACNPGRDCDLDFYLFVADHIAGCIRPHVVLLLEGDTPRMLLAGRIDIAPIPVKAGYFALPVPNMRILRIVHGGCLGEFTHQGASLLIANIIATLAAGEADAAMLESVEVNSPLAACARRLPSWLCRDRLIYPEVHRVRDMPAASGPLRAQLSHHARAQHKQRAAKLKSTFGDVRIQRFHSREAVPELIDDAERIAQKSYQRGLGVGFSWTPFIESRLAFEAQKGWLQAFVLYLDNAPCAFWIGSLRNGTFVSNYLAFDPCYSQYSPGMYLLVTAMEDICGDGSMVRLFDFGLGDASYKERLSNRYFEEAPIYIFAPRTKAIGMNALRSTLGAIDHSIKHSTKLAPQLQKIKRWFRRRAAERTAKSPRTG